MNLPNKLTISRIVLAFIILIMLCIPWHALGFSWPVYLYHGVTFNLKYINENIKNTVGQEEDYHITAFNKL